jgi:hypothetical protein
MHAWFDTMSAAPQLPYAESLAMACFAELPLAALLAWTAWRALEWAAPRAAHARPSSDGGRTPERPTKAPARPRGSEQPPEPSSGHAPAYTIEFGRAATRISGGW